MIPSRATSGVLVISLALLGGGTPNAGAATQAHETATSGPAKYRAAMQEALRASPGKHQARSASTTPGDDARVEVTVFEPPPPPPPEPDPAPLTAPIDAPITSEYGMRTHPVTGVHKLHTGTDYGAPCGAPIAAAAAGTVTAASFHRAYGNRVTVRHERRDGEQFDTTYSHLSAITTYQGAHLDAGDKIGDVGTTGYSTGCHLHFEVVIADDFVNPTTVLDENQ